MSMSIRPRGFVRRHGLVSYFLLAYGITWLGWAPYVLSQHGLGLLHVRFPEVLGDATLSGLLPGAYLGPLSSAFVVTAIAEGRPGLRRWAGRLTRWSINWRWYAFALLGVPALLVAGTVVLPGAMAGVRVPAAGVLLSYLPLLVLQMLTTGIAEEPGWRDFALPRLQRRHGPLRGTLILGILWTSWHLPLFLTDWAPGSLSAVALFLAVGILLSIIITWVFNRTRESLPIAMLIHTSNNNLLSTVGPAAFPVLREYRNGLVASLIGYGAVAVILIVATRGRLGYKGPQSRSRRNPSPAEAGTASRSRSMSRADSSSAASSPVRSRPRRAVGTASEIASRTGR
jgi:CAAX protease family protein